MRLQAWLVRAPYRGRQTTAGGCLFVPRHSLHLLNYRLLMPLLVPTIHHIIQAIARTLRPKTQYKSVRRKRYAVF